MNHQWLARKLPDIPRWVDFRGILLRDDGDVSGVRETPELAFVARDPAIRLVAVVGYPDPEIILAAVRDGSEGDEVIAPWENRTYVARVLPEWALSRAIIHQLGDDTQVLPVSDGDVRLLDINELKAIPGVPDELHRQLMAGSERSPVAAAWTDGRPVSFCYAGAATESWWDIAVDTLADYRRRGFASRCVSFMIRYMRERGKQPVWGAAEYNTGSMRLAAKLGFVPVDSLALLERRNDAGDIAG